MTRDFLGRAAALAWLAVFPPLLPADISQTVLLQAGDGLDADTGAVGGAGADLLWNAATLAPQGGAKMRHLKGGGFSGFNTLGVAYFTQQAAAGSAAPVAANLLAAGDVLALLTSGGKTSKLLVTGNSGGALSLRMTTFGVAAAAGRPAVLDVLNNSSNIPLGFPNYGIAPSSLFVVKGDNLADPGEPVLQSSAGGLPLELNGASLTVTVAGVTTQPALYYTSPKQIAAVLPAATPAGYGTLVVTYRGAASAPTPIQVVASAVGINSYGGALAVATDALTGALLTYTNAGTAGQIVVLWSTGLGANPADSDTTLTASPHSVGTPMQVFVGGVEATVLYQGSSGYPGVNQINIVIPATAPTGCWVSLAAVTGTVVSNIVTIPIGQGGVCVEPRLGITGTQLSGGGGGITLKTGLVTLVQTDAPRANGGRNQSTAANAAFIKYTGLYVPDRQLSPGGCQVNPPAVPLPTLTGLDVGSISLTGPGGLNVKLGSQLGIKGAFTALLAAGSLTPGDYTFAGSGGADVGAFTTTLNLANPLMTWSNQGAAGTIDRTKGFTATWTGGNPGSYVYISGSSRSEAGVIGSFTCMAEANSGRFTVPPAVLLSIPGGRGGVDVQNSISVPLTAPGIDIGTGIAGLSFSAEAIFN